MSVANHLPDILARRERGETFRAIGAVYNVSAERIRQVAPGPRTGVSIYHPRHVPSFIAEVRAFWDEGFTAPQIASALTTEERPLTTNAVIGIAHRNGFPQRKPNRADRRWTQRDLTTLWKRRQNGEPIEVIAYGLNRTRVAAYARYKRLLEEHGFDLS